MKQLGVALLLVLGLVLAACGSGSNSSINGNWNASLLQANNGPTVFTFSTALSASGNGGALTISNFHFTTNSPCFASGQTESGGFSLSGNFSGNVTGSFNMTVQSVSPASNTLALTGTVAGNTISGKWQLTGGQGCTGSGVFTMTKS